METELRHQILRHAVRDRTFLKATWRDIKPGMFPELAEQIVAQKSIQFYEAYKQPIGSLLNSEVDDVIRNGWGKKKVLGEQTRKALRVLVTTLQGTGMELVPSKALEDRVKRLSRESFFDKALDELIEAQDAGDLNAHKLEEIIEKSKRELDQDRVEARDFFEEIDKRVARRELNSKHQFPMLLIDPLDRLVKAIGRGMLGMFLAPYKSGKSLALLYLATAYAVQSLKVLVINLEDPIEEVEDRLDANITGIPISRLTKLPNTLKKRFIRNCKNIRGRIKIVDGQEGGWTPSRIERVWEKLAAEGFVADVIIIDYDDELEPDVPRKGENSKRLEFADIYRALRRVAAKLNVIMWTASQTGAQTEGKKIIKGTDSAEDKMKARKVTMAIGIGSYPEEEHKRHLYVAAHKLGRQRFGVDIMTSFGSGLFYDREATFLMEKQNKRKQQ